MKMLQNHKFVFNTYKMSWGEQKAWILIFNQICDS